MRIVTLDDCLEADLLKEVKSRIHFVHLIYPQLLILNKLSVQAQRVRKKKKGKRLEVKDR